MLRRARTYTLHSIIRYNFGKMWTRAQASRTTHQFRNINIRESFSFQSLIIIFSLCKIPCTRQNVLIWFNYFVIILRFLFLLIRSLLISSFVMLVRHFAHFQCLSHSRRLLLFSLCSRCISMRRFFFLFSAFFVHSRLKYSYYSYLFWKCGSV